MFLHHASSDWEVVVTVKMRLIVLRHRLHKQRVPRTQLHV